MGYWTLPNCYGNAKYFGSWDSAFAGDGELYFTYRIAMLVTRKLR